MPGALRLLAALFDLRNPPDPRIIAFMRQSDYRGAEDRARMLALVREHPAGHVHVVDLPYRLCSWAFDNPENIGLWEDADGRLLAWAVLQPPFWMIDYGLHPDAPPDAFDALLSWVDSQALAHLATPYGRPGWFLSLPEGYEARRAALAGAGYEAQDEGEDAWTQVTWALDPASEMPPCPVKAGYTLRPLRGEGEAPAYVALHRAVFGTNNMTEAWRRAVIRHPAYRSQLDLVIEDSSGELAAFCIGWLARLPAADRRSRARTGQIEPIGVREDCRRSGLAWSILAEAILRLRGSGAATILVQTDNIRDRAYAFYRTAGFRLAERITIYRKTFERQDGAIYDQD